MHDPFPEWAHVPGKTPRPPDGAFDLFKTDAGKGLQSETARLAVVWLKAGFAWEAHELLEAVWMALPARSEEKRFVQAVIQLANAELKARMGRPGAVARLRLQVRELLEGVKPDLAVRGLNQAEIAWRLDKLDLRNRELQKKL